MIKHISDFAPDGFEAGVGLALQDEAGRYIFVLAGRRHNTPPGETFYAGLGGHKEFGESWLDCAHREAREEIGAQVEIISSAQTWIIKYGRSIGKSILSDQPMPYCLYEMIHPAGTPRAGKIYRIVIYCARLLGMPADLQNDEVQGVIALTEVQVREGLRVKPTLAELLIGGGELIAGGDGLAGSTRLYPLGTARALGEIFRHIQNRQS